VRDLVGGELKHEIAGKSLEVALHCLHERARLHAVERREISVEDDTLAAQ
jgi:hypothetical protein